MRSGRLDGFCVGEPWNIRASEEGLGFTALTSGEIYPDHPEKVCAFTSEFADRYPRSVIATLQGLHRAAVWLSNTENHREAADILARPEYIGGDAAGIAARLGTKISYGDGRVGTLTHPVLFSGANANLPRAEEAVWFLSQLRRWGLHYGAPDYHAVATRVLRPDLAKQALLELGIISPPAPLAKIQLFDGRAFDPVQPEAYARSFEAHSLQG
jgi:nitrate/nitrite transport system substrate-binding protein